MRRRDHLHKKALESGDEVSWESYRLLGYQITYILRKTKRNYFTNKLEENRNNPKGFWKTIRYVLPSKKKAYGITEIVTEDQVITDQQQICYVMNSHFTSIASSVLIKTYPDKERRYEPLVPLFDAVNGSDSTLQFRLLLNNEEVYKALIGLNPTKATGSDGILARAIKLAAGQIAPSVTYLFNESFRRGAFLDLWKIAKVTSLSKAKDTTSCDAFRPISVLPCLSKVLEKFANRQLQGFA